MGIGLMSGQTREAGAESDLSRRVPQREGEDVAERRRYHGFLFLSFWFLRFAEIRKA